MRTGIVAAVDVGTTKTCCFIARIEAGGKPRLIGYGHHESSGLRNGGVVDMDAAAAAISDSIETAEAQAKETIHRVVVNISGGRPGSQTVHSEISVTGRAIGTQDIGRALGQGRSQRMPDGRDLLHFIPLGYDVDGNRGIRDPRGMYGDRLGLSMHLVTAESGPVRNLKTCVERAHLEVESIVVSPYAAGLAALVEDETGLGVTVVDMGGGTTSIAVFHEGQVVFADSIPVGGVHVTSDIARGLTTPVGVAERLKTLHGSCIASSDDDRRIIDVPVIGDDNPNNATQIPRSLLVDIIRHRLEETFEMVRSHVRDSGLEPIAGRSVVLTGGAAQLQGADQLASQILEKKVRIGRPMGVTDLGEAMAGPGFAVCAGLLHYAARDQGTTSLTGVIAQEAAADGMFRRIGSWLRACL